MPNAAGKACLARTNRGHHELRHSQSCQCLACAQFCTRAWPRWEGSFQGDPAERFAALDTSDAARMAALPLPTYGEAGAPSPPMCTQRGNRARGARQTAVSGGVHASGGKQGPPSPPHTAVSTPAHPRRLQDPFPLPPLQPLWPLAAGRRGRKTKKPRGGTLRGINTEGLCARRGASGHAQLSP